MDSARERRRLGAYYTPPPLVQFLMREVVEPACRELGRPPRVLDPACGDGRLLAAAGEVVATRFGLDARPFLHGVEIDEAVARDTAQRLGIDVAIGDGRGPIVGAPFDVVIGNPPYLSQLSSRTARGGRSALGGGPYADVAAEFLAASLRQVRADGGRVGLVLPVSVLATRDVGPIRDAVVAAAALDVWWWSDTPMFDGADVRTGILGLVVGREQGPVRRFHGAQFAELRPVSMPPRSTRPVSMRGGPSGAGGTGTWSWLVADATGVPSLDQVFLPGDSVQILPRQSPLGAMAVATADFRDQYYGLVGAVSDRADGPPLVTSGLIDPGSCAWGDRPVRFAKQRFDAPRVNLDGLTPKMLAWARARLVPKVLVASQTRILEAVADEGGSWLPSVPVVSVMPRRAGDLWRVAAVLTSPVASTWLARRRLGSGLSASAVRVTAADLSAIPLPRDDAAWHRATDLLRAGDVLGCGAEMVIAYGIADDELTRWWSPLVEATRTRTRPVT